MVLHQRAHGLPGGLLRLPQARGALPGGDLQHPSPGEGDHCFFFLARTEDAKRGRWAP